MAFRDRLIATIRAARPVLESPGALGVLATSKPADLAEVELLYRGLRPELRHVVRSNLTILSLLAPRAGMPDPEPHRRELAALLERLTAADPEAR